MANKLIVSYRGPLQSKGEISAYTAFESMLALSQATMMLIYFAETGKVRRRGFADTDVDLRLTSTREGSFEFLLEYAIQLGEVIGTAGGAGLIGGIAGEAGADGWRYIRSCFKKGIGEKVPGTRLVDGSAGALIQALEPPLRRMHAPIGRNANKIVLSKEGSDELVTFDSRSKAYLLENLINENVRTKRFLVTSFDGRALSGRVFDLEAEQGFTFELAKNPDFDTLKSIANAAYQYTMRAHNRSDASLEIVCKFTSLDAVDGRIKKLKILTASDSYDGL